MINMHILVFLATQAVSMISTTASKEFSLRNALAKMKGEWKDKVFYCLPYKDTKTAVVGQTEEIQASVISMACYP
jgi:dynein heavy chain